MSGSENGVEADAGYIPERGAAGFVPAPLAAAFAATCYRVFASEGPVFDLRIGAAQPQFDQWLRRHGACRWAIVTAHNPHARQLSAQENAARDLVLAQRLQSHGWRRLRSIHLADADDWPAEEGFLVLDVSSEEALALAAEFDQVAIVAAETGMPPSLQFREPHSSCK